MIQIRLFAFYNGKDKAIGLCNVDLAEYIGKNGKGQMSKATFQKCFDKNANVTYEIRVKEV
jgi:N-terminal C2 in EEIG1 and EHBP1 proteins